MHAGPGVPDPRPPAPDPAPPTPSPPGGPGVPDPRPPVPEPPPEIGRSQPPGPPLSCARMSDAPWAGRRLHFIGIGGAGMSGLALVARGLGAQVTGSDRADGPYCERLREAGIEPEIGHSAGHLAPGADVVVSTAIADDNPELQAARAVGAQILHRGDLLAEVSRLKRCLAVAGTHGKTTTASMVAHALVACGRRPAYLVGGEVRSTGTNA